MSIGENRKYELDDRRELGVGVRGVVESLLSPGDGRSQDKLLSKQHLSSAHG